MPLPDAALDLASRGAYVFPLNPGTKVPNGRLVPHGFKDASKDPARISYFWKEEPKSGIGIACAASGLVALDIDPRNGGNETFAALMRELGPLPVTWTCATPSGGRHLYYQDEVGEYRGKLGDGVDIKYNGYTVAPPSIHPDYGVAYIWTADGHPDRVPLGKLPDAWIERMMRPRYVPQVRVRLAEASADRLEKRSRAFVDKCEPAVSGNKGHDATFAVARHLWGWVHEGLSESYAWQLFLDYNARCQPPWREKDLDHKWESASKAEKLPAHEDRPRPKLRSVPTGAAAGGSPPDAPSSGKPRVEQGIDVHRVLDELDKAIGETDPRVYQRANELVIVCGATADDVEGSRVGIAIDTPILTPMTVGSLRPRVTRFVDYVAWKDKEWRGIVPPPNILVDFLKMPHWQHIRPIRGITETPILHVDGRIQGAYGYDSDTGYLINPNVVLPEIPESPTQADAAIALKTLLEPFDEFPYEEDVDRYAPIALILTMLLRPILKGNVPGFVQVAPQKNCGKSLLSKACCIIADGRTPGACTWPKEGEEQEKIIGAAAHAGLRTLFFDNAALGAAIGGAPLDKLLTCDGQDSFRILGQSTFKTLPWAGVVVFSGNRARIGGDADRRLVLCRLVKPKAPIEHHKHADLLLYISQRRPQLLAAAFTMARAWLAAGSPKEGCRRLDSFEQWSWTVPAIISWAGGANVRDCVRDDGSNDDDSGSELAFLEGLYEFLQATGKFDTTTHDLLSSLFPSDISSWRMVHDEWVALRDAMVAICPRKDKDGRPDPNYFGQIVKSMRGVRHGSYRLMAMGQTDKRTRWGVQK